jgi:flagellar biosynthetic protein FliQ
MSGAALVFLLRRALLLALELLIPPLVAALLMGLLSALLQSSTALRDRSLSAVPRLLGVMLAVVLFAGWIGARLVSFTRATLAMLPMVGR